MSNDFQTTIHAAIFNALNPFGAGQFGDLALSADRAAVIAARVVAEMVSPELERLRAQVKDLDMYRKRYFEISELLDNILGPNEEDGSGEGIVQEVQLVGLQRDLARAEADALRPYADDAVVYDGGGCEWVLDDDMWAHNSPGGERLSWSDLDATYGPLTTHRPGGA